MQTVLQVFLGVVALASFGMIIRGLIDMQRINCGESDVLTLRGVIWQMEALPHGEARACVRLNVDEEVVHVDCMLLAPWYTWRRRRVTDLLTVYWRKGEKQAIAADLIRAGQRSFLLGILLLTLAALVFVMCF